MIRERVSSLPVAQCNAPAETLDLESWQQAPADRHFRGYTAPSADRARIVQPLPLLIEHGQTSERTSYSGWLRWGRWGPVTRPSDTAILPPATEFPGSAPPT